MVDMDNTVLMMKDIPIMIFNFDTGLYNVLDETHLPYQLKGRIYDYEPTGNMKYDRTRIIAHDIKCHDAVTSFLGSRMVTLNRENAKKILNLFRIPQIQVLTFQAKTAIEYKAVTLQDNYWVRLEKDNIAWKDVDLRQNDISEIVAQVALHGSSLSLNGSKVKTPELSTHGAYAKCWKRQDGKLYLYKRGYKGNTESKIEVKVSKLLDKCNVSHLKYEETHDKGVYCCKCECMTNQNISMLSGIEFITYCNVNELDWWQTLLSIDTEGIYKMFIVDYLISNSDRHAMNWGLWYNCDTMQFISCHPLYDHNNAFDRDTMKDIKRRRLFIKRWFITAESSFKCNETCEF